MLKKFLPFFILFLSLSGGLSAHAQELFVGVAAVDMTPPIGVPLAGFGGPGRRLKWFLDWTRKYPYATMLKPSTGKYDAIRSKVMLLQRGSKKLLFISLDLIGVDAGFVKEIARAVEPLGIRAQDIFISATHTHAGPGTLSKNFAMALIAVDKFQKEIYQFVRHKIIDSITTAHARLEPAELFTVTFKARGIQRNRRKKIGHFDSDANLLLAKSRRGHWLGGLANLAIHGTALSSRNLNYSADMPGAIERHLEARLAGQNQTPYYTPTILFMNGTEADVSPKIGRLAGMKIIGTAFADQAMAALPRARKLKPEWKTLRQRIWMGVPHANLWACIPQKFIRKFIWRRLYITLGPVLPWSTHLSLLNLGGVESGITMLTWPGEATTSLGFELKHAARQLGHNNPWILGLANDYLAYFTNKQEFREGSYESCSSLYDYKGARRIIKGHKKLLFDFHF